MRRTAIAAAPSAPRFKSPRFAPKFGFALAAMAACLVVAAPAAAERRQAYQEATFVENAGGQATCPTGTSCGSATISGFGPVAYQVVGSMRAARTVTSGRSRSTTGARS